MKRKDLRQKLTAPIDRSALSNAKNEISQGIDPSKYHVKWYDDWDDDDLYVRPRFW